MSDIEDIKLIELLINKLYDEYQHDITAFCAHKNLMYRDFAVDGGEQKGLFILPDKEFILCWNPKGSQNKNQLMTNGNIKVTYVASTCSVSIETTVDFERLLLSRHIGMGASNKEIKKKFMRMFRAVERYHEVEVPRIRREKFINKIVEIFPDILDSLILEDHDE